ncbi:MAG: hypothetical protein JW966_14350 [Anaerolineae bacterium]|nr:hypothetical protein [Anaerolineae bacterium]
MDTDTQKLTQAKQLIEEKQYQQAIDVLNTIPDNPTAQQWLAKLEKAVGQQAAPVSDTPEPGARRRASSRSPEMPEQISETASAAAHRVQEGVSSLMEQATPRLEKAGIDIQIAVMVLIFGAVSALASALLDAILGLPGGTFVFTFGWIVIALNGPTYAILKRNAKIDGLIMSVVVGVVTALVWYIVAEILTGDPDIFDDATTRALYKWWLDDLGVLDVLITGLVVGPLGYGWWLLLAVLPDRVRQYLPKTG